MSQYVPCASCERFINEHLAVCPYCGVSRPEAEVEVEAQAAPLPSRFYPLESLATFLQLSLVLNIIARLVTISVAIPYRSGLLEVAEGAAVADSMLLAEDRYFGAFLITSFVYLATAIAFVIWFWRAYSNLTYLGRPRRRRPGWAIGAWFIPIAGMIIPYGIGAEIWTQSKPVAGQINERRDPNMEPVISWWALFLIMTVVNVIGSVLLTEDYTASDLAAYVGIDIVGSIVAIAAAVAAVRFVRLATARQVELHELRGPTRSS